MDYMERLRIQYEEKLRAKARDDYAAERQQERQDHIDRMEQRQRYVAEHGRSGAFRRTVTKWALAAGVICVFCFIGEWNEKGFSEALRGAFSAFAVITSAGVFRAIQIVNSAR